MKIMVVEDDPPTRTLLVAILEPDHEVCAYADFASARAALAADTQQALVTDVVLGDGDGVELVRALRQASGSKPRAIVVSGYAASEDVERYMHAGADAFLSKPFTRLEVLRAVDPELSE